MCEWVSCDSRKEWNEKEESRVKQREEKEEGAAPLHSVCPPSGPSFRPSVQHSDRPTHAVPGQQIDVRSKGRLMQEISRKEISPSHALSLSLPPSLSNSPPSVMSGCLSLAPRPPKVTMRKFSSFFFSLPRPSLCLLIVWNRCQRLHLR